MWDKDFIWGHGFPEQIKNFIAHSHVFIPIITKTSRERGWVHQEIGYAMALNVPILPVMLDEPPSEMLQQLLAVPWDDNPDNLRESLSMKTFHDLVIHAQRNTHPLFECAELHEDRTIMMVDYATSVSKLGYKGYLRQKGALSSMHIPDKPLNHEFWIERYGDCAASEFKRKMLREERQALEEHVKECGASLIIDPSLSFEEYGDKARKVRLESLLDFLRSDYLDDLAADGKFIVTINRGMHPNRNLTIVGDWFSAESVSASMGEGYRQTIFTRHAPTIRNMIELFDQEVEHLLKEQKVKAEYSREHAITKINQYIEKLEV